jgi:hypothetical protein
MSRIAMKSGSNLAADDHLSAVALLFTRQEWSEVFCEPCGTKRSCALISAGGIFLEENDNGCAGWVVSYNN